MPKIIPSLTGLRGVAALWVVAFHIAMGTSLPILRNGWLGVDVFFMLSGFILSHVYGDAFIAHGAARYRSFLVARIARIFPLHLFMLAVLSALFLGLPGFAARYPDAGTRFSVDCFAASSILVQNWFHWLPSCWNTPSWSLSAEWMAYIIFPIFVVATQRCRKPATCIALAVLLLLAFESALFWRGTENGNVQGVPGMLRMGLEFAAGCLIYRALATGLRPLPPVFDAVAICVLAAALIFQRIEALAVFAIALLLILAIQNRGPTARFLSLAPIVMLGEISYSVYLVHWIVIQIYNLAVQNMRFTYIETLLGNASVGVVILLISYITYRLVELPARTWGRSLGTKTSEVKMNADAI